MYYLRDGLKSPSLAWIYAVVACLVFEHIDDMDDAIGEVARVVGRGGVNPRGVGGSFAGAQREADDVLREAVRDLLTLREQRGELGEDLGRERALRKGAEQERDELRRRARTLDRRIGDQDRRRQPARGHRARAGARLFPLAEVERSGGGAPRAEPAHSSNFPPAPNRAATAETNWCRARAESAPRFP